MEWHNASTLIEVSLGSLLHTWSQLQVSGIQPSAIDRVSFPPLRAIALH